MTLTRFGNCRWSLWAVLALMAGPLFVDLPGTSLPAARAQEEAAPPAAPAPTEAADPAAARKSESFLSWMIRASGVFGFLILLISFVMVALIMMNVLQVRRSNFLPQDFIEAFEQKLNAKDYQGAYEVAKNDDSFVARVLAAGLSRLSRGYEEAVEGMQEVGEDETMAMEHKLSYLALIGAVAPMVGLMGTVQGMIMSFQVIATSTVAPKPADLADGISTALFTTLEGLIVAIPAIVFYSILKNRLSRLTLEVGMVSEGLMSRFSTLGKAGAPAPTTRAGGAAPATAPGTKTE